MKNSFKHKVNYIAVLVAIISFILGTICLLLFKGSSDSGFVAIGYFFTLFAAIVNSFMLLLVLINTLLKHTDYPEHLKTIGIVLLNIPIVFLYLKLI